MWFFRCIKTLGPSRPTVGSWWYVCKAQTIFQFLFYDNHREWDTMIDCLLFHSTSVPHFVPSPDLNILIFWSFISFSFWNFYCFFSFFFTQSFNSHSCCWSRLQKSLGYRKKEWMVVGNKYYLWYSCHIYKTMLKENLLYQN